jgi:CxxC motif-containing protein (DUF1111 family)
MNKRKVQEIATAKGHTLSRFEARKSVRTGEKLYDTAQCVKCEAVAFANEVDSQTDSVNPAVQRQCLGESQY